MLFICNILDLWQNHVGVYDVLNVADALAKTVVQGCSCGCTFRYKQEMSGTSYFPVPQYTGLVQWPPVLFLKQPVRLYLYLIGEA